MYAKTAATTKGAKTGARSQKTKAKTTVKPNHAAIRVIKNGVGVGKGVSSFVAG